MYGKYNPWNIITGWLSQRVQVWLHAVGRIA